MTDPESRSFDHLDELGRAAGVSTMEHFATVPAFEPVDRGASRGSWLFAAAAVVLVLALAAAAFAVLGNDDEDVPVVTDDGAGPTLQPLAPTYLPEGFELVGVEPPGSAQGVFGEAVAMVRSDVDDPFAHELLVVGRSPERWTPWIDDGASPVDLDGVEGYLFDDGGPQARSIGWTLDGTMTTMTGMAVRDELLVELAKELLASESDGVVSPSGWTTISLTPHDAGWLRFSRSDGGYLGVALLPDDEMWRFQMAWERAVCRETAQRCEVELEVRGEPGLLVGEIGGSAQDALGWNDPSGWTVVLESELPEEELLRVAESLEPTTWDELEALAPDLPEPEDGTEFEAQGAEIVADPRVQRLVGSPDFQVRPVLDQRQLDPGEPGWPSRMVGLEADRPALLLGEDELLLYELGESVLDGTGLSEATVGRDVNDDSFTVWLDLDEAAHGAFEALAETCFEQTPECPTGQIAVVWEGRVLSAPVVQVPGGFDVTITLGPFDSLDLFLGDFHG